MTGRGTKGGMWLIRLGMLLSIGALLWGFWVLWTHRQGTPGDPVGFYREVYRKSLETNSYVATDEGKYPRRILVVNLSDSILAPASPPGAGPAVPPAPPGQGCCRTD